MARPTPRAEPGTPAGPERPATELARVPDPEPPAPQPGRIPAPAGLPELPPALASALAPRERRLVVELVRGLTWGEALDACRVPARHRLRSSAIPAHVVEAAQWTIRELSASAAVSRAWILGELVSLYRRACQAVPVLDRAGSPTGQYRFDGPTAKNCLELMGLEAGLFGKRAGPGIPVGDVAQLLQAVAARGKPELPAILGEAERVPAPASRSAATAAQQAREPEPTRESPAGPGS